MIGGEDLLERIEGLVGDELAYLYIWVVDRLGILEWIYKN